MKKFASDQVSPTDGSSEKSAFHQHVNNLHVSGCCSDRLQHGSRVHAIEVKRGEFAKHHREMRCEGDCCHSAAPAERREQIKHRRAFYQTAKRRSARRRWKISGCRSYLPPPPAASHIPPEKASTALVALPSREPQVTTGCPPRRRFRFSRRTPAEHRHLQAASCITRIAGLHVIQFRTVGRRGGYPHRLHRLLIH